MANKTMTHSGRSLKTGEEYTEETCSVCEGKKHKVTAVYKDMAMIQCQTCKNSTAIERPILFKAPCPPTATV